MGYSYTYVCSASSPMFRSKNMSIIFSCVAYLIWPCLYLSPVSCHLARSLTGLAGPADTSVWAASDRGLCFNNWRRDGTDNQPRWIPIRFVTQIRASLRPRSITHRLFRQIRNMAARHSRRDRAPFGQISLVLDMNPSLGR